MIGKQPKIDVGRVQVPKVEKSLIERLPASVTRPMPVPVTRPMMPPTVNVPTAEIPSYEPMDYNEADLVLSEEKAGGSGEKKKESKEGETDSRNLPPVPPQPADIPKQPDQAVIEVPFSGGYELPIPRQEQVVLAGTTAFASVGATLIGKALVDQLVKLMKPVVKQLLLRARAALSRDRTAYEEQQILAFEAEAKLVKRLKQEQKGERLRQRAEAAKPLHQRILRGTESQDEK